MIQDVIQQLGISEAYQVKKYGGFYIGRYEAGVSVLDKTTGMFVDSVTFGTNNLKENVTSIKDDHGWGWQNTNYQARSNYITSLLGQENKANGNIVIKADAIPYYHADYYTAKEMSERLYNNKSSVYSGLVTGTQWDVMLKYMQDNGIAVKGENCTWGNFFDTSIDEITGYYTQMDANGNTNGFKSGNGYTTTTGAQTILTTGASEKVKKMNLYDVAGNLWEWTEEAGYLYDGSKTAGLAIIDYNSFIIRGGACISRKSYGAAFRYTEYVLDTYTTLGFRVALYLK